MSTVTIQVERELKIWVKCKTCGDPFEPWNVDIAVDEEGALQIDVESCANCEQILRDDIDAARES